MSDSKGGQQTLTLDLLASDTPNQWYAEIVATPPDSVQVGPDAPAGQVAAGVIAFTPTGQFDPTNSTGIFADTPPTLSWALRTIPWPGRRTGR